ncbi:MAG: helix-turn-helix transcriptional regulator [Burkholderiaceae bacterium]|nr:helix-turn-helix transcriptional regulator [Burkholderiaceae bacterium]
MTRKTLILHMRQWTPHHSSNPIQALEGLIGLIGEPEFESALLQYLHPVVPAASYSIYQTGKDCAPQLFMSASLGVPDTTRDCWKAYLSGPYLTDRSLVQDSSMDCGTVMCHITAQEVSAEHRSRVYEAHGVVERVSVVKQDSLSVFAINFYRHAHQEPFRDAHLCGFEALAPALISLAQKQISLSMPRKGELGDNVFRWKRKLRKLDQALSSRELDVCARMLTGMTQDGIASDLGLSVPTVKTYRNRAFARLGIHFRNELFALMHSS